MNANATLHKVGATDTRVELVFASPNFFVFVGPAGNEFTLRAKYGALIDGFSLTHDSH